MNIVVMFNMVVVWKYDKNQYLVLRMRVFFCPFNFLSKILNYSGMIALIFSMYSCVLCFKF